MCSMGVNLEHWRGSIGLFHGKMSSARTSKCLHDDDLLIKKDFLAMWSKLVENLPIRVSGLLLLFAYCTMVVLFLPLMLTWYLFCFMICCIFISAHRFSISQFALHIVYTYLIINAIPTLINYIIKVSILYLRSLAVGFKNLIFFLVVLRALLVLSGTVETNPGPAQSTKKNLSFAMWNLDSIPAREYTRIPLIETFQATYNFDIFGVCESLLSDTIPNENIFINGFSPDPFRVDKPLNSRNGGTCLYFKENLPIKERCDLETLPETIVAEIKLNRKNIFLVLSYCHPNLASNEFDEYVNALEHIYECMRKEGPTVTILIGDSMQGPHFSGNMIPRQEKDAYLIFFYYQTM